MSMFKPQSANTPKDYMSQIDEPRKSDIKTLFKFLKKTMSGQLGKVNVGRSCIRFKKLEDINLEILVKALKEATCIYKKLSANKPIIKLS